MRNLYTTKDYCIGEVISDVEWAMEEGAYDVCTA